MMADASMSSWPTRCLESLAGGGTAGMGMGGRGGFNERDLDGM